MNAVFNITEHVFLYSGVSKPKSVKQPQARFHPYQTGSFDPSHYGGSSSTWNNNTSNYPATYIPSTCLHPSAACPPGSRSFLTPSTKVPFAYYSSPQNHVLRVAD